MAPSLTQHRGRDPLWVPLNKDMRAAVGLGDIEIDEQRGDAL